MPTQGFITYKDHSDETSTVRFHLPEITVVNFTGVTQDLDEIATGFAAITNGHVVNKGFTRTYDDITIDNSPVTDEHVARESKWLLTFQDVKQFLDLANTISNPNRGRLFNIEVPTGLFVGHVPQGSDEMVVGGASFTALAAATEPNIKSLFNANAPAGVGDTAYVKLIAAKRVGRNL